MTKQSLFNKICDLEIQIEKTLANHKEHMQAVIKYLGIEPKNEKSIVSPLWGADYIKKTLVYVKKEQPVVKEVKKIKTKKKK